MLFQLVSDSVEYLSVSGSFTFDRNVWPSRSVFRIQLEPAFKTRLGVRKDGFGRTLRLAHTAIDALFRINDEHVVAFVEAVDRANLDTIHILHFDAVVGNDEGHLVDSGGHGRSSR